MQQTNNYKNNVFQERLIRNTERQKEVYLKNVVAEEHMELLITVVDAELLEAVGGEVFETKDVQNTDEQGLLFT